LPADRAAWTPIFLGAIGSPDTNMRQLDGMGGGVSSLSKVCVIGPPSRSDADVDYTFAQVSVKDAVVSYASNCGNMSSAIGPFALDEGLVRGGGNEACVRIHNTNTKKIIVSRFPIEEGMAAVDGDFVLPGVAGSGAPIRLEFVDPGGAGTGKLLPSGQPTDVLEVEGVGSIEASLIDAANPCVFVPADALGATGLEMPEQLDANPALLQKLEAVRRAASVRMGITADLEAAGKSTSIPKIAMVSAPRAATTLSKTPVAAEAMDIAVRMISVGQPHRAVPLTGSLCLAVATRIDGSIPHRLARPPKSDADDIRIANPSGLTVVAAKVTRNGGGWTADHAVVYRTARRLFEGMVYYRAPRAVA
ncbi:MAG: PrpF family protein, partial [Alphaproteobacteria bacterium]|nr:PrpF family protein [Alphaproteobacteria bacterium]